MARIKKFESEIEHIKKALSESNVDFDSSARKRDDESKVVRFDLVRDYETRFYIGADSNEEFIDIVWNFDLIPTVSNQLTVEEAEGIVSNSSEDPPVERIRSDIARKVATEDEEGIRAMLNTTEEDHDGSQEQETNSEPVSELTGQAGDEFDMNLALERRVKLRAAALVLQNLNPESAVEIMLDLSDMISDQPFIVRIRSSGDGSLFGFVVNREIYPYDRDLTVQEINDSIRTVNNRSHQAERFLKYAFDAREDIVDEDIVNDDIKRPSRGDYS